MTDQSKQPEKLKEISHGTPVETHRDGRVKATIWKYFSQEAPSYSTSITCLYTDKNGNPRDGSSFSETNLLKAEALSRFCHMRIRELKRDDQTQSRSQKHDRKRYPKIER